MPFTPLMKQIERRFLSSYKKAELTNGKKVIHFDVWLDGFFHGIKYGLEIMKDEKKPEVDKPLEDKKSK